MFIIINIQFFHFFSPHERSNQLDILFPVTVVSSGAVKSKKSNEIADEADIPKVIVTEVVLDGNPAPDANDIDIRAPAAVTIDKIENKQDAVSEFDNS